MSDTPRTDAFIKALRNPGNGEAMPRYWDFIKQIERELADCRMEAARERNRYESAMSMAAEYAVKVIAEKDAWQGCAEQLAEHAHALARAYAWKRGMGHLNTRDLEEIEEAIAAFDKLKGTK